jgi:hypothetical protein
MAYENGNATSIQGIPVSETPPTNGQTPTYNSATGEYEPSSGGGAGDMAKAVYDPTSVEGDAFDMDNMAQGDDNKFLSAAELTVVQNTSGTNTGDQVLPTRESLGLDTDDTVTFANLSGTNTGDQDLSGLALKSNVLELDNTTAFTPDADYEPATKKYVDDNAGISDVVDDTTPQLGGDLDLNDKAITEELVAGENVVAKDVLYLKVADGKYWKVDANAQATCGTKLVMAIESISADATGTCLVYGSYTTTGLTAGIQYASATTAGAFTPTAPSGSGDIVRIVGNAESTTVFFFNPSNDFIELA